MKLFVRQSIWSRARTLSTQSGVVTGSVKSMSAAKSGGSAPEEKMVQIQSAQHSQFVQNQIDTSTVNFALGQPTPSLLPVKMLSEVSAKAFSADLDPLVYQYARDAGHPDFLKNLAYFLEEQTGYPVNWENLFATASNSQALAVVSRVFTKPGNIIYTETPTYFIALPIFKDHNLEARGIPVDDDGMRIDILEKEIEKGHVPKLVYVIPTFHNPTSVSLSVERKKKLIQLATKYDFLIISDEPYPFINFGGKLGKAPRSFYEDEVAWQKEEPHLFSSQNRVLSLGTFSKILAPGLRLGWIYTSTQLVDRLTDGDGVLVSGGSYNPIAARLVNELMADRPSTLSKFVTTITKLYQKRSEALVAALRKEFPSTFTFRVPEGGYFVWLQMPKIVNTMTLLQECKEKKLGVGFCPGARCAVGTKQNLDNCLRLSFAFYEDWELEEGVRRLARAVKSLYPSLF